MQYLGSTIPRESRVNVPGTLSMLGAALLLLATSLPARADDLPQAVALPPHTKQPTRDATLSRELERALLQLGVFELLPRPGFDLEANTFSGGIRVDFPIKSEGPVRDVGRGPRALRGVYGDASATLRVQTFSGSLTIARR